MVDETYRERSGSFVTTLPGVLTALAAGVTAVGGLYLGFHGGSEQTHAANGGTPSSGGHSEPSPVTDHTEYEPPIPDPPPSQALDPSQINFTSLNEIDTDDLGDNFGSTIDDCASGSLDACVILLDQLAVECSDGFGLSCDVLYLVSPVGSDYELFGASCGGLFAEPYAGYCADL